jgi:pyruvate/2-oxoacid:ferredoxin oxidoreductase alpha subunit
MSAVLAGDRHVLLTGDHAVATAAALAGAAVLPVYPITPQTPVLEKLAELAERGTLTGDLMTVESEHSAMAACIAASLAGARVFTATASQGLALMHEMLHYAAGARAPVVMVNVNRTLAAPWGFWADHTDSLAQRDTGWIQIYCASPQEALDSVLHAYRVAERVLLPAMVVIEAMYVSHALEPVEVPTPETVQVFLPPYAPALRLDPHAPRAFGGTATPAQWRANRLAMQAAMDEALTNLDDADARWAALTGRRYGVVDTYRLEDADLVLVATGGVAGTARVAVDRLRDDGVAAGLLRLRVFRPFPAATVAALLAMAGRVAVIDRDCSVGAGGILATEVRAALHAHDELDAKVFSYVLGLGGVDVSPATLVRAASHAGRHGRAPARAVVEEEL